MREVEITLYLRDELLEYVMDRSARGLPHAPTDHFFGTNTGRRRHPDRFRDRILARAVERASSTRSVAGLPPLREITPHSLRRTWATFAAMIGRDPKWIAAQIGHVSPAFTFSVYQQVATRRYVDEEAIWALMRFGDEPAERSSRAARCHAATHADRRWRKGSSTVPSSASMTRTQAPTSPRISPVNSPAGQNDVSNAQATFRTLAESYLSAGLS